MSNNKVIYSPMYGCSMVDAEYEDDERKVTDHEELLSLSKSLKIKQLKLLHKHIIDIADELYRFSDELKMSDKEEMSCKVSIMEAIKELNNVTEYLTKQTLSGE